MKMKLAVLAALVFGISGCAKYQYTATDISTIFRGPAQAPESDVIKMSDLAWERHQAGTPIDTACSDARAQLNIKSQSEFLDTSACERRVKTKALEQTLKNDRLARQSREQRRIEEFDRRIASIRANQSEIRTKSEAQVIYSAPDGQNLALRPLVRPDHKKYVVSGFIDVAGGLQSNQFLMRTTEYGPPRYAQVYLSEGVELPPQAHAESHLFIVGTYIANQPYRTVVGKQKSMPVFRAEFVRVVN